MGRSWMVLPKTILCTPEGEPVRDEPGFDSSRRVLADVMPGDFSVVCDQLGEGIVCRKSGMVCGPSLGKFPPERVQVLP